METGRKITHDQAELICTSGLKSVELMPEQKVPLILNSLTEDADEARRRTNMTPSHEESPASISDCAQAILPPSIRLERCSMRSLTIPIAIALAGSVVFVLIESSV